MVGPNKNKLHVRGKFKAKLQIGSVSDNDFVYVIRNLNIPILGRSSIVKLNVLHDLVRECAEKKIGHLNNVNKQELNVAKEFPTIFGDIGEFKTEVVVNLKENAKPFVQSVPRRVPLPLLDKLKIELDRLIALNIIEQVDEYTEWVAPIG